MKDVADSLGVQRNCVDRWKNDFPRRMNTGDLGDQEDSAMTPTEMEAEMRELRKRLRRTEMEREILKKALSIYLSPASFRIEPRRGVRSSSPGHQRIP